MKAASRGLNTLPLSQWGYGNGIGYGSSGGGGWMHTLAGSNYNYDRDAGRRIDNSVVYICTSRAIRVFLEASPAFYELNRDTGHFARFVADEKTKADDPRRAIGSILANPNDNYDYDQLMAGALMSLFLRGRAYIHKLKTPGGTLCGLEYVPHMLVEPWAKPGSGDLITAYKYRVDSKVILVPPEDMIHIRNMIDPWNVREGFDGLYPVLREICGDNAAAAYEAALLRNCGTYSVALMPESADDMYFENEVNRTKFKAFWSQSYGGENTGKPLVLSHPIKIEKAAFSPKDMGLDKLRLTPPDRICAAFGLDPMFVGLPSQSKTYSNFGEARDAGYEGFFCPLWRSISRQLFRALYDDFFADPKWIRENLQLGYDLSGIAALQENVNDLHRRANDAFQSGRITLNEAREMTGDRPVENGDHFIWEYEAKTAPTTTAPNDGSNTDLPEKAIAAPGKAITKRLASPPRSVLCGRI